MFIWCVGGSVLATGDSGCRDMGKQDPAHRADRSRHVLPLSHRLRPTAGRGVQIKEVTIMCLHVHVVYAGLYWQWLCRSCPGCTIRGLTNVRHIHSSRDVFHILTEMVFSSAACLGSYSIEIMASWSIYTGMIWLLPLHSDYGYHNVTQAPSNAIRCQN